jgi:hypothetical protein
LTATRRRTKTAVRWHLRCDNDTQSREARARWQAAARQMGYAFDRGGDKDDSEHGAVLRYTKSREVADVDIGGEEKTLFPLVTGRDSG